MIIIYYYFLKMTMEFWLIVIFLLSLASYSLHRHFLFDSGSLHHSIAMLKMWLLVTATNVQHHIVPLA
jgi:hypothetical protein